MKKRGGLALAAALLAAGVADVSGATTLGEIRRSADVSMTRASLAVADEDVVAESGDAASLANLGTLPPEADVDGYHLFGNGRQLFSLDTTVVLPGGLLARPGDVISFDGTAYSTFFRATDFGIPDSANVDALTLLPDGTLLVSFDIAVASRGVVIQDEDLVSFAGATDVSFAFDGSAFAVPDGLDLDAAAVVACNGHLLLSFDGSGQIDGISFDDEDVLEVDTVSGSWEIALDGSAGGSEWGPADLDAFAAEVAESAPGEVQGLGVTSEGDITRLSWNSMDPSAGAATTYDLVGGSLGDVRSSGGFTQAVCIVADHPDTPFDVSLPDLVVGDASYFLVRAANACATGTYGDSGLSSDPRDLLDTAGPCP